MLQGRRKNFFLFLAILFISFEVNAFVPSLKICFFIPLIAYLIYEIRFISLLWVAFIAGLIFDAISSQYVLGAHAFSFTLSASLAYRLKKLFFKERRLTLLSVTFCLSIINTLILTVLFSNLSLRTLDIKWIGADLLLYSFFEGVAAFSIFTAPLIIRSSFKLFKNPKDKKSFTGKRPQ